MTKGPLYLDEISSANRERSRAWHSPDEHYVEKESAEEGEATIWQRRLWTPDGGPEWSGADWSNAMCGEAGEAANVVKKIRRHETGIRGGPRMRERPPDPRDREALIRVLGAELADTFLYLDLLCDYYDIDLQQAIVGKFNRVSDEMGFSQRLPNRRR